MIGPTSILILLLAFGFTDFGVRWQAAHSKIVQSAGIEGTYDAKRKETTVRLAPVQISGEKDKYHSLHFAVTYTYPGKVPIKPTHVDFELRSVVKARKLKIDLYVVFVVDGETIFLSSSRSAIKAPVRGRPWVGERLVFRMPFETLVKISNATEFAIKMDSTIFQVGEVQLEPLRDFVRQMLSRTE